MTPNTENNDKAGAQTPAFSDRAPTRTDPPLHSYTLRPHRSLSSKGFAWVICFTAVMLLVPLIPLLGSLAWWGLLPHLLLALGGLWYFIRRNHHDGSLYEQVNIWADLITVHRHNPRKADQYWQANPYWVEVRIKKNRDVKNYLTLKGSGREIELGVFLTPDERLDLRGRIEDALRDLKAINPADS